MKRYFKQNRIQLLNMIMKCAQPAFRIATRLPFPLKSDLDLDLRVFLSLAALDQTPATQLDVETERQAYREFGASWLAGPLLPVNCADFFVGESDAVAVRMYRPSQALGPVPAVMWIHGGGWVLGDLETHDRFCRRLAHDADVVVFAVDYRKAPEHPYPTPIEDCTRVWHWILLHAQNLNIDRTRLALGGDSAGGNMTAVLCQELEDESKPSLQILCYPSTDMSTRRDSRRRFGKGYFLTDEHIEWFKKLYLDGISTTTPRVSPLLAPQLSHQPKAIVLTAGLDPLFDEGQAYLDRLKKHTKVVEILESHQIHGFLTMAGALPSANSAVTRLVSAIAQEIRA